MKYFISWYPNPPDPRYWDWFEIDGLMVSLANFRGPFLNKAIILGIHRFTGYSGPIFLDSGAFQFSKKGSSKSQLEILRIQSWFDPDIVSHLDKPFVDFQSLSEETRWRMLKETIENAKIARKWEGKNKKNNKPLIVYVIQGWDIESLRFCAEKMSSLNASYYGIGSLYKETEREIAERVRLVRKIIGLEPNLHLFGVNLIRQEIGAFKDIFHLVDSSDSSSPMRAGIVKEYLDPKRNMRRPIDSQESLANSCGCPICREFPSQITLGGIRGTKKRYNRLRAIHNAFLLTKRVRVLGKQINNNKGQV